MEELRTRTRRRLIGAAVLVGAAVVLLPMALESTPRPPSAPVSIDMPARLGAAGPGAEALAPRVASARPAEASAVSAAVAGVSTEEGAGAAGSAASAPAAAQRGHSAAVVKPAPPAAPVALAAAPRAAPRADAAAPRKLAAAAPISHPASHPVARSAGERKATEADKAKAAAVKPALDRAANDRPGHTEAKARAERKETRADAAKASPAKKPAEARVFVQVGAYAEANTVKSVRQRVDKLGMKAHEQTVETASGQRTRVRLGPFASREEADRAAAKLRAGGLGATVVAP